MQKVHLKKGISIIEIVISAAIITIAVTVTVNVFQTFISLSQSNVKKTQAALLAEEASEALQILRDGGWSTNITPLTADVTYYLYWSGTAYSATTTLQSSNDYTREIVFYTVERDDSTGNIVESGTIDTNTRLYGITVYSNEDMTTPILYTEGLLHNVYD